MINSADLNGKEIENETKAGVVQESKNIITTTNTNTIIKTTNTTESDLMPIKTKKVNFVVDEQKFYSDSNNNFNYNNNNNNNNNNLGSKELDYKIITSNEEISTKNIEETSVLCNEEYTKTTTNYNNEAANELQLIKEITKKITDSNQFNYPEENIDVKLKTKTEIKENENPRFDPIININDNNNKKLVESSSNESLNQVIRIKKIDINKIEDIYSDNFFGFTSTANRHENQLIDKNYSLDTFLKSLEERKYALDSANINTDFLSNSSYNFSKKTDEDQIADNNSISSFEINNSSNFKTLIDDQYSSSSNTLVNKTRLTYPVLPSSKVSIGGGGSSGNGIQDRNLNSQSQFLRSGVESIENSKLNITNTSATNSTNSFHPTWDEWKRSHSLNKENIGIQDSFNDIASLKKKYNDEMYLNKSSLNKTNNTESSETKKQSSSTFIEETFKTQKKNYNNNQQDLKQQTDYSSKDKILQTNNNSSTILLKENNQQQQTEMKQLQQQTSRIISKVSQDEYTYHPPTPIVINDGSLSPTKVLKSPTKSPKHYPVYPFDKQPQRAPSPVRLSSVILAKTEKIEPKEVKPEPEPPLFEIPQPKKIKTILTTQKRKDSAPSLTGWRADYDSDTDTQSRLLAKASGSIPIEYISIRRDPKPSEKKKSPVKKSITTGTNTNVDYGKRIASTNTNQDELPQYNLHVSLDSLFVKSRREASTSTERQIKNVSTETDVKQRDAFTLTDDEEPPAPPPPPPPPPPPVETHYVFKSRKSRYSEWESVSNPPEIHDETYRLEFLTISPRTIRRNVNFHDMTQQQHQFQHHDSFSNFTNFYDDGLLRQNNNSIFSEVRVDDDDKIIFGESRSQHTEQQSFMSSKRSGSFPTLIPDIQPVTRRYVKHTQKTSYAPVVGQLLHTPSFVPVGAYVEPIVQNFSNINTRFNEIFGIQQGNSDHFSTHSLQQIEQTPVKTERLTFIFFIFCLN